MLHKNLKMEDGMGFESGNSVVFLLIVLLAIEVAMIFFKQVFVVVHKMFPSLGSVGFA